MNVLADACVWSVSVRRRPGQLNEDELRLLGELNLLFGHNRLSIIGAIRQEVLSGIRGESAFEYARGRLSDLADTALDSSDYELAARAHNACRATGISGSAIDMLICAVSIQRRMAIFTTDHDFERYATVLPLRLHRVPG